MIIKPTNNYHMSLLDRIILRLHTSYKKKRITYVNKNIKKIIKSLYEIDQDISDMYLYKDILSSRLNRYRTELNTYYSSKCVDESQNN